MSPEKSWQRIAKTFPYWGVTSRDEFKSGSLDAETRARFFKGGEEHAAHIFAVVERLRPGFRPARALDFGCGVGRVTIPLARRCGSVDAVDVAEGMLAEARKNVAAAELAGSVRFGTSIEGPFDLVHSHHVFQHIRQAKGLALTRQIVEAMAPGAIGILHFHHYRDVSVVRKIAYWLRSRVPLLNALANVVQRKAWSTPLILMEAYDMSRVLRACSAGGVTDFYTETLDYRGSHSTLLYLFKAAVPL